MAAAIVALTRMDAAARALLAVYYAYLSTAPCRRRKAVLTWMESSAHVLLDGDYAYLSTAPSRSRKVVTVSTRTESAAGLRLLE